jgi:hypothetical protein
MRYRKKPVEIEAEQWFPDKPVDEVQFPVLNLLGKPAENYQNRGIIKTLEGNHIVSAGDWIITGVKGEKYPCKPDIFEMTYEPAEKDAREPDSKSTTPQ